MKQAALLDASWLAHVSVLKMKTLYPRSTADLLPKYTVLQCRRLHTVIGQKIELFTNILFPHISHPYKTKGNIIKQQ
jgi:hypothetical protein